VWGYEGSAGDGDWSWDYHIMINEFRRHPKVSGWLYTEHHDVVNEWNGYWRYDRTQKFTGLGDIVEGMTLNDFHSPFYLSLERELCSTVKPRQVVDVPVYASFMTDQAVAGELSMDVSLFGWNTLGDKETYWQGQQSVPYRPWMNEDLEPLQVTMPDHSALAVLAVALKDGDGQVLHRNFTTYLVTDGANPRRETRTRNDRKQQIVRFAAKDFSDAQWTLKQWNVLEGLKVNGAGAGYFEYRLPWPEGLTPGSVEQAALKLELSSKQLFGKDQDGAKKQEGDFMRGQGTHDPSLNRNAYPMPQPGEGFRLRAGGRHVRPGRRFRGPPRDPVLAQPEAGPIPARSGFLRGPGGGGPAGRGAAEGLRPEGTRDPPQRGRGPARRPGHLRRALRALPPGSDPGLHPEKITQASEPGPGPLKAGRPPAGGAAVRA